MNRRMFTGLAAALLALTLALSVPALASYSLGGQIATLTQEPVFRAGPGKAYPEVTKPDADATVVAIELEKTYGEAWTLCEFQADGSRVRAYTELDRISLWDDVSVASYEPLPRRLVYDGTLFAAPDLNARALAELSQGETVLFLRFEGDYCLVECELDGQPVRGYLREENFMPDLGEFEEEFPENNGMTLYVIKPTALLYADADEDSEALFEMPFDASVTLIFDDIYDRTPENWIPIYYGGLFGWGRYKDFSDLRFESPEGARKTLTMMGEYED